MRTPARASPRLMGSTARTTNGASSSRPSTARPSFMPRPPAALRVPKRSADPSSRQSALPVPPLRLRHLCLGRALCDAVAAIFVKGKTLFCFREVSTGSCCGTPQVFYIRFF